MAPPHAPELNEHDVRQSVILYAALARRWLVKRDPEIARVIAPIVAAAKEDARDRDESFVAELHDDLAALYRDFQDGHPDTAERRGHELHHLFDSYQLCLSDDDLTTLDMTPDEFTEATGPADAARKALAKVLQIGDRTVHNYRQRQGLVRRRRRSLEDALSDPLPAPEARVSPIFVHRWRETLRAARAIQFVLVHFLGGTPNAARDVLKAWRRGSTVVRANVLER